MRVKCIGWVGTRTSEYPALGAFLQAVLGLTTSQQEADFAAFQLPEGAPSRWSALGDQDHEHFSPSPVVGFLVDDLAAAVRELEAVGVELLGGQVGERRGGWRHFRAEPGAANRPVSAISWVPVRIDPSHGLADGLTCGRVLPPHLGVLAAAGKIRRIRGMSARTGTAGSTRRSNRRPRRPTMQGASTRPTRGLLHEYRPRAA